MRYNGNCNLETNFRKDKLQVNRLRQNKIKKNVALNLSTYKDLTV
jgi:hypothetical protein